MRVTLEPSLANTVRLAALEASEIQLPEDGGDAIWTQIEQAAQEIRNEHEGRTVGQVPAVAYARALYRSIGIDPTKTRPSSEALLRRILKGKGLYRIHPLVDLFNLISLKLQTPVGLYDLSKIKGETVTVRIGREGEGYDGIRKDRVNVEGRFCIADDEGPFGSPTSDSLRTSIEGPVPAVLAVFFQHRDAPPSILADCLDQAEKQLTAALRASARTIEIS